MEGVMAFGTICFMYVLGGIQIFGVFVVSFLWSESQKARVTVWITEGAEDAEDAEWRGVFRVFHDSDEEKKRGLIVRIAEGAEYYVWDIGFRCLCW